MKLSKLKVGDRVSWIDGVGHEVIATVKEIPVQTIVVELTRPEGYTISLQQHTPCVRNMKLI